MHLFLIANIVTTSKALVTSSDALVTSSFLSKKNGPILFGSFLQDLAARRADLLRPPAIRRRIASHPEAVVSVSRFRWPSVVQLPRGHHGAREGQRANGDADGGLQSLDNSRSV